MPLFMEDIGEVIQNTKFIMQFRTGQIQIRKVDEETNRPISNVTFELYNKELGEKVGTYTTDEEGKIYIEHLKIGEYELKEITTKEGYEKGENMNISMEEGKTIEVTIIGKKLPPIPDIPNKQPETSDKDPDDSNKKPETPDKDPDDSNKEPETSDKEPDNSEKEPETPDKELNNSEKEPTTPDKKPEVADKEPITSDQKPDVSDKDNTNLTKKPTMLAKKEVKKLPKTGF